MELKDVKEALIKFKAVKAKLFLKEAKSMHYEIKEKNMDNYNEALALGLNSIEATILVNRTSDVKNYNKFISPRFKDIMDYSLLKDIDIAADVIQEHMDKNGHIILLTDYDADKFYYKEKQVKIPCVNLYINLDKQCILKLK